MMMTYRVVARLLLLEPGENILPVTLDKEPTGGRHGLCWRLPPFFVAAGAGTFPGFGTTHSAKEFQVIVVAIVKTSQKKGQLAEVKYCSSKKKISPFAIRSGKPTKG
jgi:hypothetical protein